MSEKSAINLLTNQLQKHSESLRRLVAQKEGVERAIEVERGKRDAIEEALKSIHDSQEDTH